MKSAGRKYSIPSPATEPVPWHRGWGKMGWTTGGGATQLLREDVAPSAAEHEVRLSTEPMVLMGDGSTRQQYLSASLGHRGEDGAVRVVIGQNDSVGVAATRDEARRFALGILALLDWGED